MLVRNELTLSVCRRAWPPSGRLTSGPFPLDETATEDPRRHSLDQTPLLGLFRLVRLVSLGETQAFLMALSHPNERGCRGEPLIRCVDLTDFSETGQLMEPPGIFPSPYLAGSELERALVVARGKASLSESQQKTSE